MNEERLIELLDTGLRDDRVVTELRAADPQAAGDLEGLLATAEALRAAAPVSWPVAAERAADRRQFMAQVDQLPAPAAPRPWAWFPAWLAALGLWIKGGTLTARKENRPMLTVAKYVFAFIAAFGVTGGGAVVASANSLPQETLYPLKLAVEDTRLALSDNGADEAFLNMEMAQLRLQEMEQLAAAGVVPDEAVMIRLQTHLQNAARLAAGVDAAELPGLLSRLRAQVATQAQTQTAAQAGGPAEAAMGEAYRLMHQFGEELDNGAREPQQFQQRHGAGWIPEEWPCGGPDCEPAGEPFQYQYAPGPAAGPGEPGGNPDCPADGCGDGIHNNYGPGAGAGPGPAAGPGEPAGNPDCPGDDCLPAGDQNQYGPGPEAGPGEPGGNPDCPADDCTPAGDQNQYGPGPAAGPGEPGGNPDCPADDCGGGSTSTPNSRP